MSHWVKKLISAKIAVIVEKIDIKKLQAASYKLQAVSRMVSTSPCVPLLAACS
jgi:hypothetical protein